MPSVVSRGKGRRTISEINMVPFIDVMLVLLIIFMVTAPLITTGVVDLPSVGKAKQRPDHVIELVLGADEKLRLRIDSQDRGTLSLAQLPARVRQAQMRAIQDAVALHAQVRVMDVLQREGVQRVGLSVKQSGGTNGGS